MSQGAPQDFVDLVACLREESVDFVIVGAHALAAHGSPRATGDLDILVRPEPENAKRLFRSLLRFGAPIVAHGVRADDFTTPGTVYQMGLPPFRIDLLTEISGVTYDDAIRNAVVGRLGSEAVRFIGIDAMIRNKRATGRTKDLADAEALEEIRARLSSRRSGPRLRDDDLEREFQVAERSDDVSVHLAFKERLLGSHDEAALTRHFDFLRRARNPDLHQMLARFFAWHGTSSTEYLEGIIARGDEDSRDRATAVQLIGVIGQRHREARARAVGIALACLADPTEVVQERAVMALGWVGSAKHLSTLAERLRSSYPAAVRAMAATQLVHLAGGSRANKARALAALMRAMTAEAGLPESVRDAFVDAAETLSGKRFGPKADRAQRAVRALRILTRPNVSRA